MERYHDRLSAAVDQRSQIVSSFRDRLEKQRSDVASLRRETEGWKAQIGVANEDKRTVSFAGALRLGMVVAGVIGGTLSWFAAPDTYGSYYSQGEHSRRLGNALCLAFFGAAFGGPILGLVFRALRLRPLAWFRKDFMDNAALAAMQEWERGKRDLPQAEARLQDLISQDPSDPAWDAQPASSESAEKRARKPKKTAEKQDRKAREAAEVARAETARAQLIIDRSRTGLCIYCGTKLGAMRRMSGKADCGCQPRA